VAIASIYAIAFGLISPIQFCLSSLLEEKGRSTFVSAGVEIVLLS